MSTHGVAPVCAHRISFSLFWNSSLLLVLFGWIVLQQFPHRLIQVLLSFFLVAAGAEGLNCISSPDKLLCRGVIHVENETSIGYRRTRSRAHAHTAPAESACTVGIPLLFLIESGLIADVEIGCVAICLGQAL